MEQFSFSFNYNRYSSVSELSEQDRILLNEAETATQKAYAPYSKFLVGAAARLDDGAIVSAANQENASFPVGICAERTLLSAISAVHRGKKILQIAIAIQNQLPPSGPVSPCGLCRQTLLEVELKQKSEIALFLKGTNGEVIYISNVRSLLPLGFDPSQLLGG